MNFLSRVRGTRCALVLVALCLSVPLRPLASQTLVGGAPSIGASSLVSAGLNAASFDSTDDPSDPSAGGNPQPSGCDISQLKACLKDFLNDQAGIWTSPLRLHPRDTLWLLPLAGATAVSLRYDVQTLQHVSTLPNHIRISSDLSNLGAYGAIGSAGTIYLIGKITRSETARETGVLSLEAIADASVVTEVLKLATDRERPYMATGQGRFWPDGSRIYTTNGSFPSEHATVIWAFSHVIAQETPGHRWLHLGLYALAAGVSAARVTSRNHFPSDVVVGSAIGYLVGGFVYRRHSDSYDSNNYDNPSTISPMYEATTGAYSVGVRIDPNAISLTSLKRLLSKAPL